MHVPVQAVLKSCPLGVMDQDSHGSLAATFLIERLSPAG
jgi:hypothetical protein